MPCMLGQLSVDISHFPWIIKEIRSLNFELKSCLWHWLTSPFKPICHVSTSELQPAAFPSLNTFKNKWVNMKLISWKIGAPRLCTHMRHAPPLGEMVRPHLHGGENSPAYIIHPLQLISDPAAPIHHISHLVILPHLIVIREVFVSANSNGSISSWRVHTGAQHFRGECFYFLLDEKKLLLCHLGQEEFISGTAQHDFQYLTTQEWNK